MKVCVYIINLHCNQVFCIPTKISVAQIIMMIVMLRHVLSKIYFPSTLLCFNLLELFVYPHVHVHLSMLFIKNVFDSNKRMKIMF